MAYLIIYDSTRAQSLLTARLALMDYPSATLKDFAGLSLGTINTYIGTLSAEAYTKIISCVGHLSITSAEATAELTFTGGAANDIGTVFVNDGANTIPIGSIKSAAGGDTADAALMKASINAGTAVHGYSADNTIGVLTITAPLALGATANAYVVSANVDNGGTMAIAITNNFGDLATGITAVGVLGDISEAYLIDLEAKIVADPETTGTAQAGAAGTITLAAADTADDDYYNGMFIYTTGGTGPDQIRRITDYNGTTKVATVDTNWGVNPDATTTYGITNDLLSFGQVYSDKNPAVCYWEHMHSGYQVPLIAFWFADAAGSNYAKQDKTAVSVSALTLTDTGEFTSGAYDDKEYYIGIKSATAGAGQIRKIASNDTNDLTLTKDWTISPTGTVVYQMAEYANGLLWDVYLPYIINTYFYDLTNGVQNSIFAKMVDRYGDVAAGHKVFYQDIVTLNEYIDKAKEIFASRGAS